MGYLNSKKNQFLEKFYGVFENRATPQTRYMKDTKCDLNNLPHFFDLLIDVSEQLLDQIDAIKTIVNPSEGKGNPRMDLSELQSQLFSNVNTTLENEEIQRCISLSGMANRNCLKINSTYHCLPVTIGESNLNHFASQKELREKATTSKVLCKHGIKAIKDSVESAPFYMDDKYSMKSLKVLSRLSNMASSIEKIQFDKGLCYNYKTMCEFFINVGKLLKHFKNLETIVLGYRLWLELQHVDTAITFNPPATVTRLKFIVTASYYYDCEVFETICENVFRSTRFIHEITYLKEYEIGEKLKHYKRSDFDVKQY